MARPLRRDVRDGWYHVFHRGTERGDIFRDARDREHFLELLAGVSEQYFLRIHAYVLMDTHYHLVVQTPEANLSQAMQWLHLSHAAWFNARHQRLGPFWQGRFRAVPVEDSTWAYPLSLYVHLNPLSTAWFGLGKRDKRAEVLGWQAPSRELATRRLQQLRSYPWSSYRAYAGLATAPDWLCTEVLLARAHRVVNRRQAQYRRDVQYRLTHGTEVDALEQLAGAIGIGSKRFTDGLKRLGGGGRETSGKRELRRRVAFGAIVEAVEGVRGQPWGVFGNCRGDWARPLVLWAARRYGGMTLAEIGKAVGGMDYAAVSMAIKRFEQRAAADPQIRRWRDQVESVLNVET
jgi:REP element-mobilizing transposase RayT